MTERTKEEVAELLKALGEVELKLVPETDPILSRRIKEMDFNDLQGETHLMVEIANKVGQFMLDKHGLGLSANQLGWDLRMFVMRTHPTITAVFNPKIVDASDTLAVMEEGCLSYPGLHVKVKRPAHIRVRYQTPHGEFVTEKLSGLTARVFQHEMDHLEGKNFLDRAGPVARDVALRKWKKLQKQNQLKRSMGWK